MEIFIHTPYSKSWEKEVIRKFLSVREQSMDTTRFLCVFLMGLIVQAVKVFNKSFLRNEKTWKRVNGEMQCRSAFEKVELEIALMKKLSHPNLVKLIDVIDDEHADRYPLLVYFPIQIIHGYRVCRKGSDYGVQPRNFRVHLSCNKYLLFFLLFLLFYRNHHSRRQST